MGIFTRKPDDSTERALHGDLTAEISALESQLHTKKGQLTESEARLAEVRSEYDRMVSDLIRIKKEINDKKKERESLEHIAGGVRIQVEEGRRALKECHRDVDLARRAAADLERITAEVDEKSAHLGRMDAEAKSARQRLAGINSDVQRQEQQLADLKQAAEAAARQNITTKLSEYQSQLDSSEAERKRLIAQLDARVSMVENLTQRLADAEARLRDHVPRQPPERGVVQAATALVASLRAKLNASQAELASVKSQLEEERARNRSSQ